MAAAVIRSIICSGSERRRVRVDMKIKANGIAINYQIEGPDNAPCLVFSNSLATTLAMWDTNRLQH
jgi:hypothetical protein